MATIAVTGAASGIGAATASLLSARGHRVIGVDLRDVDVVADLATAGGRRAAVEAVGRACDGALGGAVTCAGLAGAPHRPGSALASVNYFGTVEVLEGLRPFLASGAPSSAVAISSNATTCQPGVPEAVVEACLAAEEERAREEADLAGSLAAYGAVKLAVARWVRRQAVTAEWIGAGVRLNAVAPGMIDTPMIAEGRADPFVGPLLAQFPMPIGRPGRPEEMAALIAFLLGEDASFFCGSVVFADGGTDALLRGGDWPAPWRL